jgi:hypothetical protein
MKPKTHRPLSRRSFLLGAGITLSLPWFEAMNHAAGMSIPKRAIFTMWGL